MLTSSLLLYSKTRRIQSKTLSPLFYFSTPTLSHLFPPRQSNGATSGKQERNHMPANSTCALIGRTRYDSNSVGKKTNDAIFPREMSHEMASFLRRLKEEGCLKDGDFNYEKPVLCNSYSLNLLKSATEQFGLKHQPIAKWLSGGELKQVALFGCPSVERRTVMAAKCLRSFFRIEENTVCESCKLKTSCRFANQRVERQEKVILTYVTRLLVLYALDAIPQELSISENLKLPINKLLNERSKGLATVLAIGTALPPVCVPHDTYPDMYFRLTNSEHLTDLKEKMTRICKSTTIKQRYMGLMANDGEILKKYPNIANHSAPSLDARWEIVSEEVAKLAKEAATAAIEEWGQSVSKITHLIFCTNSGAECPGADVRLVHLLGLPTTVRRVMLYYQGCHGGATSLRIAKDLAENNRGARVLVVTSEYIIHGFRGPSESHPDDLVSQVLFGDGSAAVIVGADPDLEVERPLYELISTRETMILNTMDALAMVPREVGNLVTLAPSIPKHISENIGGCVEEVLKPLGITDLNSLFWIVHPGGPKILKMVEEKLALEKDKFNMTRKVLTDVGNLSSPTVLFIMNEMRKKSISEGKATTGDGLQFGMLLGFGPGLSIEAIVLRSVPI